MARHTILRSLVLALALAAPATALAAPPSHAKAEEQFKQGREAQSKGDYRRALDLFQASQAAEPGRGKLLNIAICEKELKLLATAQRHFEELLPQLKGDERLPIVEKHLAEIRARVPMLKIDLAPGVPDAARVKIDDEAVARERLGGEIPVDPGKHTVAVIADGRTDARQDVEMKEKEHRTIRVEAGATLGTAESKPEAPPESPPEGPSQGSSRRTAGFVVGGVGAVGLIIGAGTGIASIVDHGSAQSGCPTHMGCSQAVLDKASQGKSLAIASTVTFVAGAALAGVGVYLVVSGSAAQPKATTGLVLLPGGARFEGRF